MAITYSYFIGEITIAQTGQQSVRDVIDLFISKYSPKYLEQALGYGFAKLYTAGIAADPIEQKWSDLRDGAEYNNRKGHLKKWTGFENTDKKSPIANFIYYWYERDNATFTAGIGEESPKSENSNKASQLHKQVRSWNEMVELTQQMHDFLLNKKDDSGNLVYPEFDIKQIDCNVTERMGIFNL